jgi:hypothetical protein
MTFAIMAVKNEQRRVVGMLWTNDETNANSLAMAICPCTDGEQLRICRTEDREIPLRLPEQTVHFC